MSSSLWAPRLLEAANERSRNACAVDVHRFPSLPTHPPRTIPASGNAKSQKKMEIMTLKKTPTPPLSLNRWQTETVDLLPFSFSIFLFGSTSTFWMSIRFCFRLRARARARVCVCGCRCVFYTELPSRPLPRPFSTGLRYLLFFSSTLTFPFGCAMCVCVCFFLLWTFLLLNIVALLPFPRRDPRRDGRIVVLAILFVCLFVGGFPPTNLLLVVFMSALTPPPFPHLHSVDVVFFSLGIYRSKITRQNHRRRRVSFGSQPKHKKNTHAHPKKKISI